MKYKVNIKSDKVFALTDDSEFYEDTIFVEVDDERNASEIVMQKTNQENIDDRFLPLSITFSKEDISK